jgi:hypothetical protein
MKGLRGKEETCIEIVSAMTDLPAITLGFMVILSSSPSLFNYSDMFHRFYFNINMRIARK